MLFGLLASTFKITQRPSMWPGSPKDSTFASEEPECSRARRVTQSDPYGMETRYDRAAIIVEASVAVISKVATVVIQTIPTSTQC